MQTLCFPIKHHFREVVGKKKPVKGAIVKPPSNMRESLSSPTVALTPWLWQFLWVLSPSLSSVCLKEARFSTPARGTDVSTSRFSALQSELFCPILQLHFTLFAILHSCLLMHSSCRVSLLLAVCAQLTRPKKHCYSTWVLLSVLLTGVDSSAPFQHTAVLLLQTKAKWQPFCLRWSPS